MKNDKLNPGSLFFFLASGAILLSSGCSSIPGYNTTTGKDLSAAQQGPAVVYAKTEPDLIELTRDYSPVNKADVVADIKDYSGRINDVKLQFSNVPLVVPMENIGGSTWRAQLTPQQLELLAVSGHTTKYDANVIASDEHGKTGQSPTPVQVAVKAPDLSRPNTG